MVWVISGRGARRYAQGLRLSQSGLVSFTAFAMTFQGFGEQNVALGAKVWALEGSEALFGQKVSENP